MATTIRVSEEVRNLSRDMAAQRGVSTGELVHEAVESLRRQELRRQANAGYAALRADEEAWEEELRERKVWDTTLADGIED